MATTRLSNTLTLELDGLAAGSLRSFQPASLRVDMAPAGPDPAFVVRNGVRVALGEMAAAADLAGPGPLLDWLQAVLAGQLAAHEGAVLLADQNLTARRRIGFSAARLTALAWPRLDAAAPKQPFTLGLRWLAEAVADAPASGRIKATLPGRRKALQTSNFRVQGLPFGGDAVVCVGLPAVSVDWQGGRLGQERHPVPQGQRRLDDLLLGISARQADAARSWAHKLVADGHIDAGEGLSLQVELLDSTLKTVLASVQLDGCLLRGLDEDPLGLGAERPSGLTLRFAVAGLALKLV